MGALKRTFKRIDKEDDMALKVKDVLQLQSLQGMKLVAGKRSGPRCLLCRHRGL